LADGAVFGTEAIGAGAVAKIHLAGGCPKKVRGVVSVMSGQGVAIETT